jgi:hypothetical protein
MSGRACSETTPNSESTPRTEQTYSARRLVVNVYRSKIIKTVHLYRNKNEVQVPHTSSEVTFRYVVRGFLVLVRVEKGPRVRGVLCVCPYRLQMSTRPFRFSGVGDWVIREK